MGTLKKRLIKLEERIEISDEDIFSRRLKKFCRNISVPTVKEFVAAMYYRDRLESIDSPWIKELIAKGKQKEWLEILDMADKLEEQRRKLM